MSTTCSTNAEPPAEAELTDLITAVNNLNPQHSDAVLIDRIRTLEQLKSACAAAQARFTHTFALSRTLDGAARHHRPDSTGRSIAGQIALARRDSPFRGRRLVGMAAALLTEMPHTLAALSGGELSERRAMIIVEQFGCLTPAGRRHADAIIGPELAGLGDRSAQTRAAGIAYQQDPEAVMGKIRGAVTARHVSVRPAPDTMARLSALLPVAHGVAVYAALHRAADHHTAAGDTRSRGQLMADELVSLITGAHLTGCDPYGAPTYPTPTTTRSTSDPDTSNTDHSNTDHSDTGTDGEGYGDSADDTGEGATAAASTCTAATLQSDNDNEATNGDVEKGEVTQARTASIGGAAGSGGLQLSLIMTDRTLCGDDAPAHLQGYGPIPAALARALIIGNADTDTRTWVRRLYTDPTGTNCRRWTPGNDFSPPARRSSCWPATKPAAPHGVTRRSGTWTTSPLTPKVASPRCPTGKDCVHFAT